MSIQGACACWSLLKVRGACCTGEMFPKLNDGFQIIRNRWTRGFGRFSHRGLPRRKLQRERPEGLIGAMPCVWEDCGQSGCGGHVVAGQEDSDSEAGITRTRQKGY